MVSWTKTEFGVNTRWRNDFGTITLTHGEKKGQWDVIFNFSKSIKTSPLERNYKKAEVNFRKKSRAVDFIRRVKNLFK